MSEPKFSQQGSAFVYEGILIVENQKSGIWQRRNASLYPGFLDFDFGTEKMDIKAGYQVMSAPERDIQSCFKICTANKQYFFEAENISLMNEWILNIRNVIVSKESSNIIKSSEPVKKKAVKYEIGKKVEKSIHEQIFEELLENFTSLQDDVAQMRKFVEKIPKYDFPQKMDASLEETTFVTMIYNGFIYLLADRFCFYSQVLDKFVKYVWDYQDLTFLDLREGTLTFRISGNPNDIKFTTCNVKIFNILKEQCIARNIELEQPEEDDIKVDLPVPDFGVDMKKNLTSSDDEDENFSEEVLDTETVQKTSLSERPSGPLSDSTPQASVLPKLERKYSVTDQPEEYSTFTKLFAKCFEKQTQTPFPDELLYFSIYSVYFSDLKGSVPLWGNLFLTNTWIWYAGFKKNEFKPILWFLSLGNISEISLMKYLVGDVPKYAIQIRLVDESNHWLCFEDHRSFFSNLEKITEFENILFINSDKMENVIMKKIIVILSELLTCFKTQKDVDRNIIEKVRGGPKKENITKVELSSYQGRKSIIVMSSYIDEMPVINENDLFKVVDLLKDVKSGIELKSVKRDRLYEKVFQGSDLVTWLMNTLKNLKTRIDAASYAQELVEQGIIETATRETLFKDSDGLWKLVEKKDQSPTPSIGSSSFLGRNISTTPTGRRGSTFVQKPSTFVVINSFFVKKNAWFGSKGDMQLEIKQDAQNGLLWIELVQNGVLIEKKPAKEIKEVDVVANTDYGFYIEFVKGKWWLDCSKRSDCIKFLSEIQQQVNAYQ